MINFLDWIPFWMSNTHIFFEMSSKLKKWYLNKIKNWYFAHFCTREWNFSTQIHQENFECMSYIISGSSLFSRHLILNLKCTKYNWYFLMNLTCSFRDLLTTKLGPFNHGAMDTYLVQCKTTHESEFSKSTILWRSVSKKHRFCSYQGPYNKI